MRKLKKCGLIGLLLSSVNLFSQSYQIDSTFAQNSGNYYNSFSGFVYTGNDVITTSDDKIFHTLSIGASSNNFAVFGMNKNGSIDSTFGPNGVRTYGGWPHGASSSQNAAIQSDDMLIIGGTAITTPGLSPKSNIALIRIDTNGSMDYSFADSGRFIMPGFYQSSMIDLEVDLSNDKIYIAGNVKSSTSARMFIMRLTADGNFDSSFYNVGYRLIDYDSSQTLYNQWSTDIVLLPTGEILMQGIAYLSSNSHLHSLYKFTDTGNLDSTYGINGKMEVPYSGPRTTRMIHVENSSYVFVSNFIDIPMFKIKGNGKIDSSFGGNGSVIIDWEDFYLLTDIIWTENQFFIMGKFYGNSNKNNFFITAVDTNAMVDSNFYESNYEFRDSLVGVTPFDLAVLSDKSIVFSAQAHLDSIQGFDFFSFKLFNSLLTDEQTSNSNQILDELAIYPNPSNGEIFLKSKDNGSLKLYDTHGLMLMSTRINKGTNQLNLRDFGSGVYFYSLISEGSYKKGKILIVK